MSTMKNKLLFCNIPFTQIQNKSKNKIKLINKINRYIGSKKRKIEKVSLQKALPSNCNLFVLSTIFRPLFQNFPANIWFSLSLNSQPPALRRKMSRPYPHPAVPPVETAILAGGTSMKPPPSPENKPRPIIMADLNVDPPETDAYAFSSYSSSLPVSRFSFSYL